MKNFLFSVLTSALALHLVPQVTTQAKAATSEGNRLLVQAIQQNDVGTIQQTLQLRVDINAPTFSGLYAIHASAKAGIKDQIIKILLENGANPNIQDSFGQTALHIAATANSVAKVKTLLGFEADPNISNHEGETALHAAITSHASGATDITQLILDSGKADLNLRNHKGLTPLMLAVLRFNPSPKMVQALLASGADKGLINLGRFTAMDFAQGMLNYFKTRASNHEQEIKDLEEIVGLLK